MHIFEEQTFVTNPNRGASVGRFYMCITCFYTTALSAFLISALDDAIRKCLPCQVLSNSISPAEGGARGGQKDREGNVSDYLLITRVNEVCGAC